MKNTATIGIAALLAGAAGGYLAGKAGAPATDTKAIAESVRDTKTARPATTTTTESKRQHSIEDIMREPGQLARMQSLMDLYAGMDASQLEAEAAKLDSLPMGQRIMASFLLFGRWGEVDPQGALSFSKTMGFGGMFARPTILQSWASVDPENAAKYFSENPREFTGMGGPGRGPGGDSGASVIAAEWAKLDPEAALAWASGLEGRDKTAALNSVISEMASKDPAKAIQAASSLTGEDQTRAYSEIASKWASSDFASAEAWIQSLPAEARDGAMASALQTLAQSDPVTAAAKVAGLPAGEVRDRAIADVAGPWARTDPAAAAAWVAQQQSENIDNAIRPVMVTWAGQNSTAALSWIQQQPQGDLRDEATATYIFASRGEPQTSIQLAETIADDGTRNRTIGRTVMEWMQEDKEAATAYVQSSTSLSDDAKQRLLDGANRGWGGPGGGRNRGRGN